MIFKEVNSKQKGGTVVKLTAGLIDRTEYYVHALKLALAPFLHDDTALYARPEAPAPAVPPAPTPEWLKWSTTLAEGAVSALLPFAVLLFVAASSGKMPGRAGDDTHLHANA